MALVYLGGSYLGYWQYDEKVAAAFGFTGLAALRSGVKRAELNLDQ